MYIRYTIALLACHCAFTFAQSYAADPVLKAVHAGHACLKKISPGTQECQDSKTSREPARTDDDFNQLLDEFANNDKICFHDAEEVRKRTLGALNTILKGYDRRTKPVKPEDYLEPEPFYDNMIKKWHAIFEAVKEKNHEFNKENETIAFFDAQPDKDPTPKYLELILETGLHPIGVTSEFDSSGQTSLFSFGPTIRALFLGVAPISVGAVSDKEMAERDDHPFSPELFDGMYAVLGHEFQHTLVLAKWREALNLGNPKRCENFRQCLLSIPELKEKDSRRKGVYYLLREDPYLLNGSIDKFTFLEFAFESMTRKKDEHGTLNFPLASLMGASTDERKKACGTARHISEWYERSDTSSTGKKASKAFTDLTAFMTVIMPEAENLKKTFDVKSQTTIDGTPPLNLSGWRFMIVKLKKKCDQWFDKDSISYDPNDKTLEKGFKAWKEKGFPKELDAELGRMQKARTAILEHINKSKACGVVRQTLKELQ